MATRKSTAAAIAGLDAMTATIGTSGVLQVFEGTLPATCELADAGTLLSTHALANPAFGGAVDGTDRATATAGSIGDDVSADATGTAQYFRMKTSAGGAVQFQGPVTITGSGGDLTFDTVNFTAGGLVTITSFLLHLDE